MTWTRTGALVAILATLAAIGCGGSEDTSGGSAAGSAGEGSSRLSLVASSTPEVVSEEIIPAFRKTGSGKDVGFKTSFGASG